MWLLQGGGGAECGGEGKVNVHFWDKAGPGADDVVAKGLQEWGFVPDRAVQISETCFSRRSQARARAGQWRMACWKNSSSTLHWGQVVLGPSSNQEGSAAK